LGNKKHPHTLKSFLKKLFYTLLNNKMLIIIILTGLVIRYLFFSSLNGIITYSDSSTYLMGAKTISEKLWVNEYRPPVYPAALALIGMVFSWEHLDIGVILLQIIVSSVNTVFVYKIVQTAFGSRIQAYITAFLVSVGFRIYSWDFVILSENFSILLVTLITYCTILYIKNSNPKQIKILTVLQLVAILTKPFFLLLPFATAFLILSKRLISGGKSLLSHVKLLLPGLITIYLGVIGYSLVNLAQNGYFGVSTVGNVNYFGKILQYDMYDLGDNDMLKDQIEYAINNENPEYIVNNSFLEPWHFVVKYGWNKEHYRDISEFSKKIMLSHPFTYTGKSLALTYELFTSSPFTDFIADAALIEAGRPNSIMIKIRKLTDKFDNLYFLLVPALLESVLCIPVTIRRKKTCSTSFLPVIMAIILYHYLISAFFSYGDYGRLLVPSYTLIYTVICLYIYRILCLPAALIKRMAFIFKSKQYN